MPPVITDNNFPGSDDGLAVPVRRLVDGPFGLRIENLDRTDPPTPYKAGGVPRSGAFNTNVLTLPVGGGMPELKVLCKISGFDPSATPILWRLQTRHVLGRFQRSGGTKNDPSYKSKVVSLSDEWRGQSSAPGFTLFAKSEAAADHVGGGHAILSVAVKPPGATAWLQDFTHLRIVGANPDRDAVKVYIRAALPKRDANLWSMLDAIFAWEAGYKQFRPKSYSGDIYKGVSFKWPADPSWFPLSSFDFGVGLSQFTHPDQLTASIAWDWRDNMSSGINIFLDALRSSHKPGVTWIDWAIAGWTRYNGSGDYAAKRAKSDDGKLVSTKATPNNLDLKALTSKLKLIKAPTWPAWPADTLFASTTAVFESVAGVSRSGVEAIVEAVSARVTDRDTLLWVWPQIEAEVLSFDSHLETPLFPGIDAELVEDLRSQLSRAELQSALQHALVTALQQIERSASRGRMSGPTLESTMELSDAAASGSAQAEWNKLSIFVRKNIGRGFAGYIAVRTNLLSQFGAPNDPDKAIRRINAYYGQLTGAAFPKPNTSAPVHPDLKARLDKGKALAAAKNASAAVASIGKIGGFNIRPNANDGSKLSFHSFGWAVDIDWDFNPNIKRDALPLGLIKAITGVDLYGPESTSLRTPAAYDKMLPAAQVLSKANTDFKAAFASASGLKSAMGDAVKRLCGIALSSVDLMTINEFATAQPPKLDKVQGVLTGLGVASAKAKAAAKLLVDAANLFRRAATQHTPIANGATDATVAHYGFFNHAPELVAALSSSEGAGLRWLGAAIGTKDYMHFELFPPDQPKLF
ncbi:hypothetical protein [Mesorhizobium sp. WSM3859]|uniref:hypothetical protein n=1 Tax=Mesorhizobium sp. WSM3859 TaxID=2029402 RepID=UPI000BB0951D|nr:hypothetical protein [Mesorhizobium sp. WSM3859]PBC08177.1 hypothetical protein CK230_21940 [Mesorhizobium sp. WSM3859]